MLGAIIGDIVGSRFEFNNTHRTDFDLFTSQCGYTDDTICTIAVADAILQGQDFGKTLHEWCNRYPNPMGAYGGRFSMWVHSPTPMPYNSFGNGSAMRVAPCGWLATREEVLNSAVASAQCTHNHPEGIKGAMCIADCIFAARNYTDKDKIKNLVTKEYGYDLGMTCDEIKRHNPFDETCQVTVPQAIVCFLESESFESAIRFAVSIGGDSDTICAMTGSIAEAFYGITSEMKDQAMKYLPSEMKEVLASFKVKYGCFAIK